MSKTDVTVVLAHGAWADGSSWARVIEPLRGHGLRALAAPLPLTSLEDDVAAFAPQATADAQAVLAAVQRPLAPASIMTPAVRPLWRDRPSWYLAAEQDVMMTVQNQRFMAERMGARTAFHPVDHTPMIAHPQLVTATILEAVAG